MVQLTSHRPGFTKRKAAPQTKSSIHAGNPDRNAWRKTEHQTLQAASQIAGVSVTSLYRAQNEQRLHFKRLCGRVVVTTESLIELVDSAEDWQPSGKGKEARAARRAVEQCGAAA
jgi:hypothetical protein